MIGRQKLAPMSIYEAVEVMKILGPYADDLSEAGTGIDLMRKLSEAFARDNTEENIGRLLALMEHRPMDEIIEEFRKVKSGEKAVLDLVAAFRINPIPDLLDAGLALGILKRGWSDARSDR